jgi:hypothetical protein
VYPAVLLVYFISAAAVILLASLALIAKVSLLNTGESYGKKPFFSATVKLEIQMNSKY